MSTNAPNTEEFVKVSFLLTKRSDISHEQFLEYWTEQHTKLLSKPIEGMPVVHRYVQQHPIQEVIPGFQQSLYDGIAEVWYGSVQELVTAMSSEHYRTVIAKDEENFLDRTKTVAVISRENVILSL